ncbi:hypothetical protein Bbelb_006080 [Branchiostoma belcheri]|nr:hypothetical protein Bbelb_006080 [Branchiostoma belcheri]
MLPAHQFSSRVSHRVLPANWARYVVIKLLSGKGEQGRMSSTAPISLKRSSVQYVLMMCSSAVTFVMLTSRQTGGYSGSSVTDGGLQAQTPDLEPIVIRHSRVRPVLQTTCEY